MTADPEEEGELAIGERGVDGGGVAFAYAKPVPRPDEASRPFYDATLRGELVLQRCTTCGRWMWPVRVRCIECFADGLEWAPAQGTGTLYSFTLVHQVFHPGFAGEIPYNVAMVDLTEGVRVITNVVGVANDALEVGMPLVATFERISDELALPKFEPSDERRSLSSE